MVRRAKILATVGPATDTRTGLRRLLRAGADGLRLNQSHGTPDQHRATLRLIREVSEELGREVAVVVDLMGPRYRVGRLEEPVELKRGRETTLGTQDSGAEIPLHDPRTLDYIDKGERILIDNGLVELLALGRRRGLLRAKVIEAGTVSTRKGINLPDSQLPFEVSKKDRADVRLAVEEGADYLAASYVGSAKDVEAIRRVARRAGAPDIPIIAKLERARAVTHLDEIVMASDAVMVARGDLGVEVPLHEVPVIQKRIIDAAWRLGKPVIVATQMLESMVEHRRPTRAESSDVANAVFDGADALMLSGETAAGRFPIKALRTMVEIIEEAESYHREHVETAMNTPGSYDLEPPARPGTLEIPETVSAASVMAAKQLKAKAIIALTEGGFTARQIACRRPSTPVYALTSNRTTARQLQLVWGLRSLAFEDEVHHHGEVVRLVDRCLLASKTARKGDVIIVLMGDPIQLRPPTNLMRIHRVRKD